YVANLHIFHPIFSAKKSGEVIGMAAAGQSIKRRFGRQRHPQLRKPRNWRQKTFFCKLCGFPFPWY
ncbi:hypothetical protein, partial [Enterobacter hormaechei]|uniref:hypothetical protein n=1 Tax=Enterobacter hormaechei TaxID=158836 RepID=UPI001C8DA167